MIYPFDSPATLIIATLLLLPLIYFVSKQCKSHDPPLPPGPTPWPILGTIHLLKPITHVALADLARVYGPLMLLRLGTQFLVVASSPAAAAEILKAKDRILSARAVPHSVPLAKNHLSFWDDALSDRWKYIRAICRAELFSTKALKAQAGLMEEKAAEMVEWLRSKEGLAVNVQQMVYATVLNMFGNILFSKDVVGLEEESRCSQVRGLLRGIIEAIAAPNLCDLYPFLGKLDPQGLRKKHSEISMRIWGMWETILEERRRSDKGDQDQSCGRDFTDILISKGFTDDQINKLFEELFSAGIDTTTSTITRTTMELVSSPETITKLKQELDSVFDQDSFRNFQLEQLPYLHACVMETLRMHPPAPTLLSHRAREPCRVMNYSVPKNARVLVNVWAIGRDPMVWEQPNEYRPERFLSSGWDYKGNDFEFLPFGSGRRICPGLPMAAKIVPLVVASLIWSFDWSRPHESTDETTFRATSQMTKPPVLIPRARKLM